MLSRREVLGLGAGLLLSRPALAKDPVTTDIIMRTIPSTGEAIPAIGLGSWQTFDVADPKAVQPVLERFLALGGRVVDTSPMYGRSEAAIGAMVAAIQRPMPWITTKVWTTGKQQGIAQMKQSMARLGVTKLDLMQIHNLVDWRTHMPTLREWKAAGTVRYIGISHYGALDQLEQVVRTEPIDFVQLPYSAGQRGAEKRLLPAAADKGVAVLVMEPFSKGQLFSAVRTKKLPAVADELGCTSWAQLFLKFLLAHPAVTCPIPATSKVKHLEDNLAALRGPVPTSSQRDKILAAFR
ncbi:MAG: aldo/keto reductase [Kofleriaceae bacterium]